MGKREQLGERMTWSLELTWLSLCQKSQSSPVIKMKSIISLGYLGKYFGRSIKENDETNVIFMPSFGRTRWRCLATTDFLMRRTLTRHPASPGGGPDLKCWWVEVLINGSGQALITIFSSCYRPISEWGSSLENTSNLINELRNINGVRIISGGISVDQKVLRELNDVICGFSWENLKTVRTEGSE